MRGSTDEATGGVYGDIRRGFPREDNPTIGGTDEVLMAAHFSYLDLFYVLHSTFYILFLITSH